jgi:hypothetical protein
MNIFDTVLSITKSVDEKLIVAAFIFPYAFHEGVRDEIRGSQGGLVSTFQIVRMAIHKYYLFKKEHLVT